MATLFFVTNVSSVESSVPLIQQLHACTKMIDILIRVNCYDRLLMNQALTDQSTSMKQREAIPISPPESNQQKHFTSGKAEKHINNGREHQLGSKYLNLSKEKNIEPKVVLTLIEAKKGIQSRKWSFVFSNGQIWQQIEAKYISMSKNKPVVSTISKGAMGSYNLRIGQSSRSIKVKRLE